MEIKTCEQYVLAQLFDQQGENDMRKRNPSDSAERRFFMLVEQALGAHR